MKPNIFALATKELSQDAFFTWLLQWADASNSLFDSELTLTAQEFVRWLIRQDSDYVISSVEAGRQLNNIDIWALVNNEFFIVIEDKTNTREHSNQLARYRDFITDHHKDKNYKFIFIYLKTGNESIVTLQKIKNENYVTIDRKGILGILDRYEVKNDIFVEFRKYLSTIEEQTNACTTLNEITSHYKSAEGFYMVLQNLIAETTDWGYVANQTGGFLGFWYHWTYHTDYQLYIQIENSVNTDERDVKEKIKVVIKMRANSDKPDVNQLYQIFSGLETQARKFNLILSKPSRFRSGTTSTIAIAQDVFTNEGILDIPKIIQKLGDIEKTLDDFTTVESLSERITTPIP
jgi:hypothetical protein